jgi:hypothetical protein
MDAPHIRATPPQGNDEIRVPVRSNAIPVSTDGGVTRNWTIPRPPALSFLTGTARFFIEVQGVVVNPNQSDPCFWRAYLYAPVDSSSGTVVGTDHSACASEAAVLPAGTHAITVTFAGQPIPAGAADHLVLVLVNNAVLAPGASVSVVTGTPDVDSTVSINGLQLPITTQTLSTLA